MINRIILWLSLAGMVLALHLWIQKARGFDQGCFGLSKHEVPVDGGCLAVSDLPASHLLGVSNAAWGYAFYFALALASFAKIVVSGTWARRLHQMGEVAVALAFAYTCYLLYTMAFVADEYCALCLVSAALVLALGIVHVSLRMRGGFEPLADSLRATELGIAAGSLFAAMGVLVAVVIFVNRLGTRPLAQGATGRELDRIVGNALPLYIDGAKLAEMHPCRFDDAARALDLKKFIGADTPFLGNPAGVPVIVFFDPNCPHCKDFYPEFLRIVDKYKTTARFYVLPRILWNFSDEEVRALTLAQGSGKYFELWTLLFDRQKYGGLSRGELTQAWRDLGLDPANLVQRLAKIAPAVAAFDVQAFAVSRGVPSIFIGTRKVWGQSQGEDCVGKLLETVVKKPSNEAAPTVAK